MQWLMDSVVRTPSCFACALTHVGLAGDVYNFVRVQVGVAARLFLLVLIIHGDPTLQGR